MKRYGDYNVKRLMRAKNNIPGVSFFGSDLTKLPLKDNSFDIILCNHVIEHIKQDQKALSELLRVLKKGGTLILGTPNEGAFIWRFRNYILEPYIAFRTDHVNFYKSNLIISSSF